MRHQRRLGECCAAGKRVHGDLRGWSGREVRGCCKGKTARMAPNDISMLTLLICQAPTLDEAEPVMLRRLQNKRSSDECNAVTTAAFAESITHESNQNGSSIPGPRPQTRCAAHDNAGVAGPLQDHFGTRERRIKPELSRSTPQQVSCRFDIQSCLQGFHDDRRVLIQKIAGPRLCTRAGHPS